MSPRLAAALALFLFGCARVPADRYGIEALAIEGAKQLDADAVAACLYSKERATAELALGLDQQRRCGEPPFDHHLRRLKLWSWFTSDWPIYDRQAFTRDVSRIVRWYEARGYHQARVVGTSVEPKAALQSDLIDKQAGDPGCERVARKQGCKVRLTFVVDEGKPTLVQGLEVDGVASLGPELSAQVRKQVALREAQPMDEALLDKSKAAVAELLQESGYALAEVSAAVQIDRSKRTANVRLHVTSGPLCHFGVVRVEGAPPSQRSSVHALTSIDEGDRFSLEAIKGARRGVFNDGSYSDVQVEPILPKEGDKIDVLVTVTPVRRRRFGVGVGLQAGIVTRGDTWDPVSVPQWDVHLVAKYTQHQLFGGARRLVVEERPALIIQEPFPDFTTPRFGNELRTELRQAGVIDARTSLTLGVDYVFGPDPYDTFFRHRVDTRISLERRFLAADRLYLAAGFHNGVYRVPDGELTSAGGEPSADSLLSYFFQRLRLDYRDDGMRPRRGFMYQTEIQESGMGKASSWKYLRITPDARAYIPLPLQMTFALRFALGVLLIQESDAKLDQLSRDLGPRDLRLRGGGATSNRGFLPGELGDGSDGGTRRWEASGELRVVLTDSFGVVGFFDAGDVSREPKFRWQCPQASAGFGLRYYTVIGALRLDFAWRIENLQVIGPDPRNPGGEPSHVDFGFATMDGAIHLTIGESF